MTVFYLITLESIAMPFLQQSCTRIKAAFSIRDKMILHKKCKVSAPAVIAAATASQISFFSFLFHNDSYSGLNYFEMVAICSCRPQSVVHMKQFTFFFFFNVMAFLHFLEALPASLVALNMGPMVLLRVYTIALNRMKIL